MILVRLFTPIATLLVVGAAPGWARADETPAPVSSANETPPTAFAALVRAAAAYEYGDMVQVVDAARPVAEGTLPSSAEQRARALRLLGIGLFLTNRALGADNAFAELLRVDPSARLDPTTTRPEVVAFFENIRHQHVARERAASRHFIWNLLPPVGQFRNGDALKGWIVGGLEFASIATIVAGRLISYSWHNHDNTYGPNGTRASDEHTLRVVEWTSAGVLAAAYIYGVIDGIVHYYRPPDDSSSPLTLLIFPGGGGLRLTF
jgi:hypothetical protein